MTELEELKDEIEVLRAGNEQLKASILRGIRERDQLRAILKALAIYTDTRQFRVSGEMLEEIDRKYEIQLPYHPMQDISEVIVYERDRISRIAHWPDSRKD